MKSGQKFRIASFGLDVVVMAVLFRLAEASGGGGLHWGLVVVAVVCGVISTVLYGEYILQKYGPKQYGADWWALARWLSKKTGLRSVFSRSMEPMSSVNGRSHQYLHQYVIYENPSDYPDRFVVRKWRIRDDGNLEVSAWPTKLAETIELARACLPVGLINIGRQTGDDPVIREVWT